MTRINISRFHEKIRELKSAKQHNEGAIAYAEAIYADAPEMENSGLYLQVALANQTNVLVGLDDPEGALKAADRRLKVGPAPPGLLVGTASRFVRYPSNSSRVERFRGISLDLLRRAIERQYRPTDLGTDPRFKKLWNDPSFQNLIGRPTTDGAGRP